jgi:two-component system cell cycle response regulator
MIPRILLISNDESHAQFFNKVLDSFVTYTISFDFKEIDLIFIQAEMALAKFIKELSIHNIPIIIIFREIDYIKFEELLSLGATDYLVYPLQKDDLRARIAIHNNRNIQNRLIQNNIDSFTGLYNKNYFFSRIKTLMLNSIKLNEPLSLIFIDLDQFKKTNDEYGHVEGDRILKEFVAILKSSVRKTDIVSRFGGDEFTLLLPNADNKAAKLVAQRISSGIKLKNLSNTASFGISSLIIDDLVDNFVNRADKALYRAKSEGGNRVITI